MPFTIAHAAAVLPLHKLTKAYLPLSALMVGSMSPDFAYFLPDDLMFISTHGLAGLFLFCLPVGLAAWLLFVAVLERPAIEMFPHSWRVRIQPTAWSFTPRVLLSASLAILLGAVTHILWDSFTHRDSLMVDTFPVLRTVVMHVDKAPIQLCRVLQHLSTVIGMSVLLIWALRIRYAQKYAPSMGSTTRSSRPFTNRARLCALLLLLATSFAFALARSGIHLADGREVFLFRFAIGGMTGWMLAWCVIAAWISRQPPPAKASN